LQGTKSRCSGQVVCPGSASDQNSYRSKVSGLLAILIFVDLLVKFFAITSGSIEVACDGESTLNKIFLYISVTNILDPCFDLISTAQHLWRQSPLHWKTCHIKGHQDDIPSNTLDIYAKLNIEMDECAKLHLRIAQYSPRHFITVNEPWSVWIDNNKITSDLDKVIYEVVHAPLARSYWANKQQLMRK
jgi:hypothetical protein